MVRPSLRCPARRSALQKANTGEVTLSGVWKLVWDLALSLIPRTSERTEQDCADEREYSAHRQNIESQGKVHVTSPSSLTWTKV